jgi:hypothetical protein
MRDSRTDTPIRSLMNRFGRRRRALASTLNDTVQGGPSPGNAMTFLSERIAKKEPLKWNVTMALSASAATCSRTYPPTYSLEDRNKCREPRTHVGEKKTIRPGPDGIFVRHS